MAEKLLTGASFKAPDWQEGRVLRAAVPADTGSTGGPAAEGTAGAAPAVATPAGVEAAAFLHAGPVEPLAAAASAPTTSRQPYMAPQVAAQPAVPAQLVPAQPAARAAITQPDWQPPATAPLTPTPIRPAVQPAASQPQLQTHINELPDDLLQHIFSLLPFRKR